MPAKQVKIQLSIDEDLSGLSKARSALDDFNKSAAQGTATTKSAIDNMSKSGVVSIANLQKQVLGLKNATQGTQQLFQTGLY